MCNVNQEYHKGEQCPIIPPLTCQEGYCSDCQIKRDNDAVGKLAASYRELNSNNYFDYLEDNRDE